MSALTPLYLLGILAVAAPVVFHLIRRAPRGEVPFSSLLFLTPSPPKLTRRSRLDNILLLFLRASVLFLLACAFARPFLREKAEWNPGEDTQHRTAILIDTSASMRRGDLWRKAKVAAQRSVADCGPTDEFAVLTFNRSTWTAFDFRQSSQLGPELRQGRAQSRIEAIQPTWQATDLGRALVDAVAAIEDVADKSERAARMPRRIVLVSDLQQGARLDALGEFEWPKDIELEVKTITDDSSNAGLQRLADPQEATAGADREPRVRVFNDAGSRRERFSLQWAGDRGELLGDPIDAYVPPGESRVVRVPRTKGPAAAESIVLQGDNTPFDNTLFVLDEPRQEATAVYIGDDRADDPDGLLYYLTRVFVDTPRRTVKVATQASSAPLTLDPAHPMAMAVIAADIRPENARRLREHAQAYGTTLLYVATRPSNGETLATLLDAPARPIEEAPPGRDALIGEIAFDHPLFAPFAAPQFSDFTKIHFWKHRMLGAAPPDGARVLARFDNGDPAVMEKPLGKGSLVIMASGWSRGDSQLARSSKFVPLMMAFLDRRDPRPFDVEDHAVGDRITLPVAVEGKQAISVSKPSGQIATTAPGTSVFDQTDEPGIYTIDAPDGPRSFVVNLDPAESKTAPMNVETLEQYGCRLAKSKREQVDWEQVRQLRNAELEARQKLWRWLILAAIVVLIVETILAGGIKRNRRADAQVEGQSS